MIGFGVLGLKEGLDPWAHTGYRLTGSDSTHKVTITPSVKILKNKK